MKLWSDRKTDEEYVEQMRKKFKRKWPFARVLLLVEGLAGCGYFVWYILMLLHAGDVLIWTDADRLLNMQFAATFMLGTMAGMMFLPLAVCLFWAVFWSWQMRRDVRLMLKYHGALVAHGISPDEQEQTDSAK